ncbi:hypothetical protein QE152_g40932 [Popillia japonica]|uniref:Uncharacterized protein n=1 Tax=Popillia japonica TaxID=7064 RepID=A0AAW1HF27_POPJA
MLRIPTNSFEVLNCAEKNDILLLCLPLNTTPSKEDRRITSLNFGKLLHDTWGKAASVQNAVSGFRVTAILNAILCIK